jgi:hypothetical protein
MHAHNSEMDSFVFSGKTEGGLLLIKTDVLAAYRQTNCMQQGNSMSKDLSENAIIYRGYIV